MKYILADQFGLRGYNNGKQQVLVNLNTGNRISLIPSMAHVLKVCDGTTDLDKFTLFPVLAQMANKAYEMGWLVKAEPGNTLRDEQKYKVVDVPDLRVVQWSITGLCNARCRHCFISKSQLTHKDITTDEMLKIIDELDRNQVKKISITGGEPLLRKDFPLMLEELYKRDMTITGIATNGFLLDDRMIELFAKYNMHPSIQISYDGVGHHDWMRGIKGAEELTIAAMDACKRNGISYILSMCVHRENVHLIPETIRLAAEHGADGVRIALVGDIGGFADNEGMTLFSLDEAAPYYLEYIPEILLIDADMSVEFTGFLIFRIKEPEKYTIEPIAHNCTDLKNNRVCSTVEDTFYISDEGRVMPCMLTAGTELESKCYKLTEHSFEECVTSPVYDEFLHMYADKIIEHNEECQNCEHLPSCGCGCRGAAISGQHSIYGIEIDRCKFFKGGWQDKIKEVMTENIANSRQN